MAEEYLFEFYGTECVHCKEMVPLMDKLQKELGVTVKRLEVWHNSDNLALLRKFVPEAKQIPVFFNEKTGAKIIGNTNYENLKKWASDK
jgi:thiol-disulfide isomerase/thioredoxin